MIKTFEDTTFHVGLQKTGSTFLQRTIFPSLGEGTFIGDKKFSFVIEDLSLGSPPFLVSGENLSARGMLEGDILENTIKMYSFISNVFPKSNILLFLREPSDYIVSSYKQSIYQGAIHSFENHASQDWSKLRYIDLLDAIGKMNFNDVLVFDYEQLRNDPVWVFEMIERVLGNGASFSYSDSDIQKRVHKSFDKNGLRFVRFFNRFVYGNSHPKVKNPSNPKGSKSRRLLFKMGLDPVCLVGRPPFSFLNRFGEEVVPHYKKRKLENEYGDLWGQTKRRINKNQKAFLEGRFEL